MEFKHIPVLFNEVMEGLQVKPDGIYVDGTTGGGGHSEGIAKQLSDTGRLFCFDQDADALKASGERLSVFGRKVTLIRGNYENAVAVLKERGIEGADGILLDIGVSSYQLDNPERGFSYNDDAPLDMRMDRDGNLSAYTVVNEYSREELTRIFKEYGEERFASKIAENILKKRASGPVKSTFELNEIIRASIPAKMQALGGHPSKRVFQAIRIECNRELEVLENSIEGFIDFLKPGGRLLIISFQSLEDRIVKNAFRAAESPCICPPGFPVCVCGKVSKGKVITRHPVTAGEEELKMNKRAKPAKLRIFEKTDNDPV